MRWQQPTQKSEEKQKSKLYLKVNLKMWQTEQLYKKNHPNQLSCSNKIIKPNTQKNWHRESRDKEAANLSSTDESRDKTKDKIFTTLSYRWSEAWIRHWEHYNITAASLHCLNQHSGTVQLVIGQKNNLIVAVCCLHGYARFTKSCKSHIFCTFCMEISNLCCKSAVSLKRCNPPHNMQILSDYVLNYAIA